MKLFAILCWLATAYGAHAQELKWESYQQYLVEPSCVDSSDKRRCFNIMSTWKSHFLAAITPPIPEDPGRQIKAQNQMYLCFRTGCVDAVKPDPLMACAWARAKFLSHGQPYYGFVENACSKERLPDLANRQAARLKGDTIFAEIARRK